MALARELLVDRQLLPEDEKTSLGVRSREDIISMIDRLKRFAKDEEDPNKADRYNLLAELMIHEASSFEDELQAVARSAAFSKLATLPMETRKQRNLLRLASAGCLVLAGVSGWVGIALGNRRTAPVAFTNKVAAISTATQNDVLEYPPLVADPGLDTQAHQALLESQNLLLNHDEEQARQLQATADTPQEKQLASLVEQAVQTAKEATNDPQQVSRFESEIESLRIKNLEATNPEQRTVVFGAGILVFAFGVVGIDRFVAASRRGGRLDQRIKAYKEGKLSGDHSDVTASNATNSRLHLGRYPQVTRYDLGEIIID